MPTVENIKDAPVTEGGKILKIGRRTKVTREKALELTRKGTHRIVHKSLKTEDDRAIDRFYGPEDADPAESTEAKKTNSSTKTDKK